jgi:hypothetical protein
MLFISIRSSHVLIAGCVLPLLLILHTWTVSHECELDVAGSVWCSTTRQPDARADTLDAR